MKNRFTFILAVILVIVGIILLGVGAAVQPFGVGILAGGGVLLGIGLFILLLKFLYRNST
jgi:hypothetical protein